MKLSDILFWKKTKSEASSSDRSPTSDFWYYPIGLLSNSGVTVTPENAVKITVVWACDKVISETIASLSLLTYKRLSSGGKLRAPDHRLYHLLHNSPNNIQTAFEYIASMQHYVNLYGNAYSVVKRNAYGEVLSLGVPIHPSLMKVKLINQNGQEYLRYENQKTGEVWIGDEIWHWKENAHNGLTGTSPIGAGSEAIGLAMATEKYGASFFAKGYRPNGVVEGDKPFTDLTKKNLKESLRIQAEEGLLFLDDGNKFKALQQTAEEAQYISTRQHQIEEICRLYDMPLHRVQHLLRSTFNNVESQEEIFYRSCILKRLKNIEQSAAKTLFNDDEYYVEFLMESLLRADVSTRVAAYVQLVINGLRSRNECRILDNLSPYEGGDRMLIQQNLAMIDEEGDIIPVNNSSQFSAKVLSEEEQTKVDEFVKTATELKDEKEQALEQVLTEKKENTLIESLALDASQRIARAEIREIEKIGDNAEKKKGFYNKHYEYISKTLAPFNIQVEPEKLTLKECEDRDFLEDHIYYAIMGEINDN